MKLFQKFYIFSLFFKIIFKKFKNRASSKYLIKEFVDLQQHSLFFAKMLLLLVHRSADDHKSKQYTSSDELQPLILDKIKNR